VQPALCWGVISCGQSCCVNDWLLCGYRTHRGTNGVENAAPRRHLHRCLVVDSSLRLSLGGSMRGAERQAPLALDLARARS